jgi:hypothetical protein
MKLLQGLVRPIAVIAISTPCFAAAGLSYPGDCKNNVLERAAQRNGCTLEQGGNHGTVKKNGAVVTQIPRSVKDNGTCREIIKALNEKC